MRRIFIASFFVIAFILVSFFANIITSHAAFTNYSSDTNWGKTATTTKIVGPHTNLAIQNDGILVTFLGTGVDWSTFLFESPYGLVLPANKNITVSYDYNLGVTASVCRIYFYNRISTTDTQVVQTYINLPAGSGSGTTTLTYISGNSGLINVIRPRSTSALCTGTVLIKKVWQSDDTTRIYFSPEEKIVSSGSTTTVPLFTPSDTAKLNSMTPINCVYSATSSICTPQTASTTIPITPENLFFLVISFVGSFLLTIFLIRKLT